MYEYPGDISSEKQNEYNTTDNIDMRCNKKSLKIPRIRISKRNSQHNGQKIKDKRTNKDLQDINIKLKIE